MNLPVLILVLVYPVGLLAFPTPKCPTTNLSPDDQAKMIHRIVQIGDEGRKTIDEMAAQLGFSPSELKRQLSGLGTLSCGGGMSTAQLSGANDVITFTGHSVYGPGCEFYGKRKNYCIFRPLFVDHPPVYVDSINAPCPYDADSKAAQSVRPDWAVGKLRTPVKGALPFRLRNADVRHRRVTEILLASAQHYRNFNNGDRQPTVQRCAIRGASAGVEGDKHDCDTDGGASGAAQLDSEFAEDKTTDKSIFTLIGIHTGGTGGVPHGTPQRDWKNYEYNAGDKNRLSYNTSTPIAGEFRQAILKAIGN